MLGSAQYHKENILTPHTFIEQIHEYKFAITIPTPPTNTSTIKENVKVATDIKNEEKQTTLPEETISQEETYENTPPHVEEVATTIPIQILSVIPADILNTTTREALVNILCEKAGYVSTGSGVIIDPRGFVLTNAHVAEHFLDGNAECIIRTGYPALPRYYAHLIHIPQQWVAQFHIQKEKIDQEHIGQNDFALLFIDASLQPNDTLPTSFPFIPPNVEENIFNDFPFFLAGYAVDTLNTQLYVNTNLFASSVSVPLQSVYAFKDTNNIDLLFFAGTAITRVGSSGGAVVRATDGTLQGVITALTTETETKDRTLIAISLSHINRSIFEETGNTLREFIDSYDDDIVILNN